MALSCLFSRPWRAMQVAARRGALLSLMACAGGAGVAVAGPPDGLDIMHWWVSPGEQASMQVMRDAIEQQGIAWKAQAVAGSGTSRFIEALRARVQAGQAPTAAQMIGFDIQDWARAGQLRVLDDIALRDEWDEVVPIGIQALSKYEGHWVAAPINAHSTNWLWVNAARLRELGAEAPDTWDDLVVLLDQAKVAGLVPLALGGEAWEHTLLFETVAVSAGGAEFYRRVFLELDGSALDDAMAATIFARMRLLREFIDPGFRERRWDEATEKVRRGTALLQVQGSWVEGEFTQRGLQAGVDFECFRFPDTQGMFLFNSDQYVFLRDGPGSDYARERLLVTLMDPEFQAVLNVSSGAAPARVDVAQAPFAPCGQRAIADMRGANMRRTMMGSIAMGNANPAPVKEAIYAVVTRHLQGELSDEQAVAGLRAAIEAGQP